MSARDERRRLSAEEREMWSTFTKKIAPLRPDAPPRTDEADRADFIPRPLVSRAKKSPPGPAAKAAPPPPKPPPLAPLSRREKQRVARGRLEIDARLDLHGYTQDEAHAALLRFLHKAGAGGAKMVLVITGKSGVLRRQVPQWLALPEFRSIIIGFESAHVAHGGEGALYVRVRRVRG
jgi:DNA-nicking Smr family endonuclease